MPQVIVSATGGPLDGEVFDMQKCKKGGLLLRWSAVDRIVNGNILIRVVEVDERGKNITPYIWDGKRLSYERA